MVSAQPRRTRRARSRRCRRRADAFTASSFIPSYSTKSIPKDAKSSKTSLISKEEQVRKRGLPPLILGSDKRGQAPLPDLFFSRVVRFLMVQFLTGYNSKTNLCRCDRIDFS